MKQGKFLSALLLLSWLAMPAVAQNAVGAALNKCAAIADDGARLTCYDALAEILVTDDTTVAPTTGNAAASVVAEAPAATAAVAATAASGMAPLTDEVGKERVAPTEQEDNPRFSATVTSCRQSEQSGQYYFTFENGQVWKQSNYRHMNMRSCEFDVEISKSAFGYQMYIPSKDRTVRISRIR